MHEYCVILAGGTGLRFWPLSREDCPKQFVVTGRSALSSLQKTYRRMMDIFPVSNIYIASLERFRGIILQQLPLLPEGQLLLEPYGRGTAPVTAYAAYKLLARDPAAVMAVVPSDQEIEDPDLFENSIREAIRHTSERNSLVTIGVIPDAPNCNYGYVQVEGGANAYAGGELLKAKTFTEKPSQELARVFVESGEFLWNSGIFVWTAEAIISEMDKCCPEITRLWNGWQDAVGTPDESAFVLHAYADSPNISIDYAVLEKSDNLWVLPAKFAWSDVGTWSSFYEHNPYKDEKKNMVRIRGKHLLKDISGNILISNNPRKLIVIRGLKDCAVIDTDDVLMICPLNEDSLKDTMSELISSDFDEFR